MRYEVLFTAGAERDLQEIHEYISKSDSEKNADHVLERLVGVAKELSSFPERGTVPKELQKLGIREYRQTFFKPYRVIYRIVGEQVIVYIVADGRRDKQSLLARRLLGA